MIFSPDKSLIRGRFKYCTPDIFAKLPEVDENWNVIQTRYDHPHPSDPLQLYRLDNPYHHGESVVTEFLQDSRRLLSISDARDAMNITIWQVEDGSISKTAQIHSLTGAGVRISSDLKWLVVVTSPSRISPPHARPSLEVRDFSSNKVFLSKELTGGWRVQAMEISPNHQWVAVCYEEVLELYDLNLIKSEVGPIEPKLAVNYPETVKNARMISFSSDSTLIALGTTCAFDVQRGLWYHSRPPPETTGAWDAKFVPGTHTLASCTTTHNIDLWHVSEGVWEQWSLPHKIIALGFGYSDTWIAIYGEDCLYLYNFEKRTLIQSMGIPFPDESKQMLVSRDGQKVVISTQREVLVLHIRALLAQTSPLTPPSKIQYHMSDNGGLVARCIGERIDVWDTSTGTRISESQLLPLGYTAIKLLTFSPKGQDLAFTYYEPYGWHIFVWNLSDNRLRYYGCPHSITQGLAVSDNGGEEGYWLAAANGFCVSV